MNYDTPISKHWQLAPTNTMSQSDSLSPSPVYGGGQGVGAENGITQGADDVDLCIHHILSTRKGADVLRPDFGSNHFDYLDTPEDVFIPNVVREVILAIQTWEKRAIVENVKFEGNAPHITMIVQWRIADEIVGELYQSKIYVGKTA